MKISNLSFSYNDSVKVISDISFEVKKGEIVCIIGKSGCGKTTLLNLIVELLIPNQGLIDIGNRSIAYLSQKPVLLQYRNSFENAMLGIELRNNYDDEKTEKLNELFSLLDLNGSQNLFPDELSGGMKQRVGIAQTLIIDSEIYLLDEPFNAIDRNTLKNIEKYIWSIFKEKDSSAVLITHDIEQALLMCDRIIMLSSNPGKIVFDKTYPSSFCMTEPSARRNLPDFNNYLLEIVKEFSKL